MSQLAIPPLTLSAYLQNVVCGRSMREIAASLDCEPSTVLRRIRRCEELRDHPEWETVLEALEGYRENWPEKFLIGRKHILAALGLTAGEVSAAFAPHLPLLHMPGTTILVGDFPTAAIMHRDEVKAKVDRNLSLAALAFGWIAVKDTGTGKVRKFEPTPGVRDILTPEIDHPGPEPKPGGRRKRYCPEDSPIVTLMRRKDQQLVTADHLRAAQAFEAIYNTRTGFNAETYKAICKALPPRLVTVLDEVCGKHTGLETLESHMKLPARSGKAVLAMALDAFMHAGLAA